MPLNIRLLRKATYVGTVTYADSDTLLAALRGNATYRGVMWDEFEGGSGVLGMSSASKMELFVQDSVVLTTFHHIRLEPTHAIN